MLVYIRVCQSGCWSVGPSDDNPFFDAKNKWFSSFLLGGPTVTLLNVLSVLSGLNLLNMPKDTKIGLLGLVYFAIV